jgi:hypothetical protein
MSFRVLRCSIEPSGGAKLLLPALAWRDDLDRIALLQHDLATILTAHELLIAGGRDRLSAVAELLEQAFERRRVNLERLPVHRDLHA